MSAAVGPDVAAGPVHRPLLVDLGWRNIVFSLSMACAAILALAITYWLDLSDPQWATLTVYILGQPTVGAALSKGTWRAVGTTAGGLFGLLIVALFSQAPALLVAATVLTIGTTFYAGARLRNFVSYGALLAGYTALLVAFEGSVNPPLAWSIAADRIAAILIGIACSTMAGMIILPRYAGDALQAALKGTFHDLADYVAAALRLSTPPAVFARLRGRMVAEVISFDGLRASARFEAPQTPASAQGLERIVREFLMVLAVARGLFFRLDAFKEGGGEAVEARLRPTLAAIAARVEGVAADPMVWHDPGQLRGELHNAHRVLGDATAELESMAGTVPFEPLANGVLILARVGHLLDALAVVVIEERASLQGLDVGTPARFRTRHDRGSRREALLSAARAAFAVLLLSVVWMATGWSQGFTAISGGAIMLFFAVNQDNPEATARTFAVWSACAVVVSYLAMVFVLPHLEGFEALAAFLILLLLPAGLLSGTPNRAVAGMAFGVFTMANLTTGNTFTPNEQGFVNSGAALLLGMAACLPVFAAFPVTTRARRRNDWRQVIGTTLPAVMRGSAGPRHAADEIVALLAALLPRLALDRQRDEDFFRGMLSAASCAIELGRLVDLKQDASIGPETAAALGRFLEDFASALEGLAAARAGGPAARLSKVTEAEAIVAAMRAHLADQPLTPGPAAHSLLQAGASLRFIADRFHLDRAFLGRDFDAD